MKTFAKFAALSALSLSAFGLENWQKQEVIQINTTEPRATFKVFESKSNALKGADLNSEVSLNGTWKFNWSKNPAERPANFYKNDFDTSLWADIKVPGNWQIEGFGTPLYTNIKYPFDIKNPPFIDNNDNPVGSYVTNFEVPANFSGKSIRLHFAGVNSAFYLWINGEQVGYSQGSRTPAEFDITEYLKPGKNRLAAEVYRWGDGAFLEDQDFWRLSGIFRDVTLKAISEQHINDFTVVTDLDEAYENAELSVSAELTKPEGASIDFELLDASGKAVFDKVTKAAAAKVELLVPIANPAKWTPESPNLYTLIMTLKDADGNVLEVVPQKVGFREVEIKGGIFLVNGQKVKLKGVNRHEHHPVHGQIVNRADMIRDLKLFKENNINAVRTSHYPNVPEFYDLCNEYGIFVIDEANIETHEFGATSNKNILATDKSWEKAIVDRVERMAERDKNHPSIVIWSLGNESGTGPNFQAAYKFLKDNYPHRPVHYEGGHKYGSKESDFYSRMYANEKWIGAEDKPSILCEYSHAMGNSNGNLKEYWEDNIYKHDRYAGAFIWDWMDQGLTQSVPDEFAKNIGTGPVKDKFFAYGGWFKNPYHNDGNFCMNGLIAADWTPHPGLFAVKYVYSNVKVEALDSQNGKFKVTNRFDYSTLDRMVSAIWSIEENGKEIANGKIKDFNIAPKESKEITLNLPKLKKQNGKEYFLNLSFHSKKAYSTLVEPGHELSFAQFKLGGNAVSLMTAKGSGDSVTSSEEGDSLIISGNDFTLSFDKKNGVLSSYSKDGKELIVAPIQYSFWRPFTDNDKLPIKFKKLKAIWRDAAKTQKLNSFDVKTANGITSVVASIAFPKVKSSVKTTYEIYPDGQVKVSSEYDLSKADKAGKPHRIGMIAEMPAQYDQFSWFGYGPGESYSDRNYKRVGTFNSTVDAEWMDYSRPQENGNKVGLRWMSLDSTEAKGLTFAAYGKHLSGSARFYTLETMEKSKYSFEMERSSNVIVNIDAIQMGIGGNDSWGSLPLNSYLLSNKKYTYSFIIK